MTAPPVSQRSRCGDHADRHKRKSGCSEYEAQTRTKSGKKGTGERHNEHDGSSSGRGGEHSGRKQQDRSHRNRPADLEPSHLSDERERSGKQHRNDQEGGLVITVAEKTGAKTAVGRLNDCPVPAARYLKGTQQCGGHCKGYDNEGKLISVTYAQVHRCEEERHARQ